MHIAAMREESPHTSLAPFMDYFDLLVQGAFYTQKPMDFVLKIVDFTPEMMDFH